MSHSKDPLSRMQHRSNQLIKNGKITNEMSVDNRIGFSPDDLVLYFADGFL
jgi:hypothetical protein